MKKLTDKQLLKLCGTHLFLFMQCMDEMGFDVDVKAETHDGEKLERSCKEELKKLLFFHSDRLGLETSVK